MAELPVDQSCDTDEPYETVIFRNSMIIYPEELAPKATAKNAEKPRQSLLNEFDPLAREEKKLSFRQLDPEWQVLINPHSSSCPNEHMKNANEPLKNLVELSESFESDEPPPVPPRRAVHVYDQVSFEDNSSNLRKVSIKGIKGARTLFDKVVRASPKPPAALPVVEQGGLLRWNISGKVQTFQTIFKDGFLSYIEPKSESIKFWDPLNKIIYVGVATETENEVFWFEISNVQEKRRMTVLGTNSASERYLWMFRIVSAAFPAFRNDSLGEFERAGKVYVKEGISGDWKTFWIFLQNPRKLWRFPVSGTNPGELTGVPVCEDLRKVRSISLSHLGEEGGCYLGLEAGPVVVVDWSDHSLYIQADLKRETESWNKCLRSSALQSGTSLEDQQLTGDDVPVLVERCLRFISSHGILSEGIYRKSGINSKIQKLLELLRFDAWNVRVSNDDYSEHDVSNVLKRFFRTLPEPLLTEELYWKWISACSAESHEERLRLFSRFLKSLPRVNYQTLKRLLGHLHAVHDQCEKNLMTSGNLASMFGPNLMTVESGRDAASSFSQTGAETDVLLELIQNYPWLFDVDPDELRQERELVKAVERIQCANIPRKVDGGNMIVWVHYGPEAKDELSITVWPSRTVAEVVAEVGERLLQNEGQGQRPIKTHVLMEFVCDGSMKRPLAFNDPVLPVILSWLEWPEEDRRNNRLVFCQEDLFVNIVKNVTTPGSMFVEVRYADPKTKQFRKCPFEFCQARLVFLKDCKNHAVQGRFNFESVTWYMGSDSRRSPPTQWVISFIEKGIPLKRTKESPYLGHSVSFNTESEYQQFLMSLIATQFREGLRDFVLHL